MIADSPIKVKGENPLPKSLTLLEIDSIFIKEMRYARFKIGLVPALLAIALLPGMAHASGTIRLSGTRSDRPSVSVVARSGETVTISCDLGWLERFVISSSAIDGGTGEDFVRLSLSGGALTAEIGKPALPMVSAVLDVPQDAVIELVVEPGPAQTVRLRDLGIAQRIMPALEPVPKIDGAKARFALDRLTYGLDSFYPSKLAEIDDISARAGLARGHRLAAVRFYPVQYNPATGELRYYPHIKATVRFRNGDLAKTTALIARDYSPDWEGLIRRLVVNYTEPLNAVKDSILALPICYDIFYGGTYAAAATKLADWKQRKGYTVRTWNASGSGWSAQTINDTILAQSPQATYLVVMSDPDGADPLPASANGYATGMVTDLYYAETDESGYFPDLFNARISVKTADEAMIAVDKVIRYEQADFGAAGTAWLKRAVLIAGYDYGGNQPVCIATNEYCRNILAQHGYAVDTLILAPGEGKARIVSLVNAGTAWTIYSAHGGVTNWTLGYNPWYASQLSTDLGNQNMYTLPVGHCCNSGDFQSESKAPGDNDCFGETWPRLAGKGGVSYFGSVPSTYWDEDDWLQRRYFDALYDSAPGLPGLALNEIGRFTQYGLFWIDANTGTGLKQHYFEAYHVFNDPAMDFWTNQPAALNVSYPASLPRTGTSITVTVRDQATTAVLGNALVCAWSKSSPGMRSSAYTNSLGSAVLPLGFTTGGDTVLITVSRHDYRPHLGYALMGLPVSAAIAPRIVDINVPTRVSLALTDPDSGDAPVDSVAIYLASQDGDSTLLGTTDAAGQTSFLVTARQRSGLKLLGWKPGQLTVVFEDSIRVSAPAAFDLMRAAPNPFRQTVRIAFNLYQDADVTIAVYNLLGQKVRTLVAGRRLAGYHSARWDGKDERGAAVTTGIYFCRFKTPWSTQFQRMMLIE